MTVGIAFSGGGGKGAYAIGVWKALEEYGLASHVTSVSGTSVGALNAALFLQGDYKKAEEVWLSIKPSDILHLDPLKVIVSLIKIGLPAKDKMKIIAYLKSGLLSRSGLTRIISESFDQSVVDYNKKNMFLSCTQIRKGLGLLRNKVFDCSQMNQEEVGKVLLASSAIPVVFGVEEIEGYSYIDGYFTDNTPVKPLYDSGSKVIIVIFLGRAGGIFDDAYVSRKEYPGATIINIVPQKDLGGFFSGVLNFNDIRSKIDMGYKDACKIFEHHRSVLDSQLRTSRAKQRLIMSGDAGKKRSEIICIKGSLVEEYSNEFREKLKEW